MVHTCSFEPAAGAGNAHPLLRPVGRRRQPAPRSPARRLRRQHLQDPRSRMPFAAARSGCLSLLFRVAHLLLRFGTFGDGDHSARLPSSVAASGGTRSGVGQDGVAGFAPSIGAAQVGSVELGAEQIDTRRLALRRSAPVRSASTMSPMVKVVRKIHPPSSGCELDGAHLGAPGLAGGGHRRLARVGALGIRLVGPYVQAAPCRFATPRVALAKSPSYSSASVRFAPRHISPQASTRLGHPWGGAGQITRTSVARNRLAPERSAVLSLARSSLARLKSRSLRSRPERSHSMQFLVVPARKASGSAAIAGAESSVAATPIDHPVVRHRMGMIPTPVCGQHSPVVRPRSTPSRRQGSRRRARMLYCLRNRLD